MFGRSYPECEYGGCSILCSNAPILKDLIRLGFTTRSGLNMENCGVIVRSLTPVGDQFSIGCQFQNPNVDLVSEIEILVATRLSEAQDGAASKAIVLIIETGSTDCLPLRDELRSVDYESFVARGALEGLSCAKDLRPQAILIGHTEGRTCEHEVCALLKETHGMEETPVSVYNIEAHELSDEGKRDRVSAYFSPETDNGEIVQIVGAALSQDDA